MDKIKKVLYGEKEASEPEEFDNGKERTDSIDKEKNAVNLELYTSKSQEFDPVSSRIEGEIQSDEYAAVAVEDDSPYAEVRAAIPSTDDPSLPQNTIRAWTLGLIAVTIGCGVNVLFNMHSPSTYINAYVVSILAWPVGMGWAKVMPNIKIFGAPLNPGPFNIKEHTLITIMANVSIGTGAAYATDVLLTQNVFYKSDFGWGFAILAIFSTQCIGFALGGLSRRVLVRPASAIWPSNLVTATFLTNLHINENHEVHGWKISRLRFFTYVFIGSFVYYWLPGYIFTGLSYFSWITWIKPKNVIVNQIFGSATGLGMFPNSIALDWNQINAYIGSPLIPPASTIATILLSLVTMFWIVTPAIHYSNNWYSQYLPISSSGSYDRYGQTYNVSRIIDTKNLSFKKDEYEKYSPLFLSTTFALCYGLSFATMLGTITHTICFHGKDIINQIKLKEKPDVHQRLMQRYRPVPDWWFAVVFLIFFALSIATIRAWDTQMPVWALVIALLIATVFLFPVGIIYSLTNIEVGLNVVAEFIAGYMLPGKPLAMMFFKTFGYITNSQAVTYVQDMKLAHYMKVAPRVTFWGQFVASIWGSLVQIAVLRWSYTAISDLCSETQASNYTCPNGRVFFNASIIWGVIGPQRQFSAGQIYNKLMYFFIVGAGLPVASWLILKKWPSSPIRWLNWPVFFSGTGYIPPATPYNYTSYCIVGLAFGWWVKAKWFHWWAKYNYSLSAGLDIGLAWSMLIVFLALQLSNIQFPSWWGNSVVNGTLEQQGLAIRKVLPEGEAFGPSKW